MLNRYIQSNLSVEWAFPAKQFVMFPENDASAPACHPLAAEGVTNWIMLMSKHSQV